MILLTGATGYVGGRLVKLLEQRGQPVRCLARNPKSLEGKTAPETEVVKGDLLDRDSLEIALQGVKQAYYLVHSMGETDKFADREYQAAHNFIATAEKAGVERIIYLGGLGEDEKKLSEHLHSRHEVGRILRNSNIKTIEFRASIIIGSGSLSFELIRALVRKLPVMITPRWVWVEAQPIAINDVLEYLYAAMEHPIESSEIYEIGGADKVSYGELIREYARQRGLRRYMIAVPVLTPRLSSLWLHLVTPVHAHIGRKLVDGIQYTTVVTNHKALDDFSIRPVGIRSAIAQALRYEDREFAETHWSDALSSSNMVNRSWGGVKFGSRIADIRECFVGTTTDRAFEVIQRIGGKQGWYYADWLWTLRGYLDILAGGVGKRRGRRNPDKLYVGDAVDWWRVEAIEPGKRLMLRAEMKVPGRAWLEFTVEPEGDGCRIRQTALFDPAGLLGLGYWYALYLLHQLVFTGMLRGIACAAERK